MIVEACIKIANQCCFWVNFFLMLPKSQSSIYKDLAKIGDKQNIIKKFFKKINLNIFSIFLALHLLAPCLEIWPAYGEVGLENF
jgi:hypothetical protein